MMKYLRKYQYQIFLITIGFFLLGTFIGFGGYFFGSAGSADSIAEVNGKKISLNLFYSHYRRALDDVKPGTTLDDAGRRQKVDETVRELVQSVIFKDEADRYGIQVPDQEVAYNISRVPVFQEKGAFSPQLYGQLLQQVRLSPQEFEEEQRRAIAFLKLRWLILSVVKVTDKEAALVQAFAQPGKTLSPKEAASFREQVWEQKVSWSFNQWFNQIGQHVSVKTHLQNVEGIGK